MNNYTKQLVKIILLSYFVIGVMSLFLAIICSEVLLHSVNIYLDSHSTIDYDHAMYLLGVSDRLLQVLPYTLPGILGIFGILINNRQET
jgi:lipopolysaccharide export LptBFGC system permease protein LptF